MSDVALVALFSGAATVLVAVCGLLGTIFGPARAERARTERQLKQEAIAQHERSHAIKVQRAEELSEAIVAALGHGDWNHHAEEDQARIRFIATLKPGEGAVAQFVNTISDGLDEEGNSFARKRIALERMGRVFDWLRGDVAIEDLNYPNSRG